MGTIAEGADRAPVRARRRRAVAAVLLVAGAATQLGFSCEPACSQPYRPVASRWATPGGEPVGDWPVTGVERPAVNARLDTDGDGTEDTTELSDDGTRVTVHRGSGDLVLTLVAPDRVPVTPPEYERIGDLDGDGRTELMVTVVTGGDVPRAASAVVPGATPDGVHALDDVAAHPFATVDRKWGVGDLDGDGRDDVAEPTYTGGTPVWLGADLDLTPGAGPVASSHVVPGRLTNAVALDGRDALSLQTEADWSVPWLEFTLWVPGGGLRYSTEGSERLRVDPTASTYLVDDGDTTWLVVQASGRGGYHEFAWDLGDPCAGAVAAG